MAQVLEATSQGLTNVTFVTGYADRALPCHTADPELFFSEDAAQIAVAKNLCGGCPVASSCLEGALSRSEPWGVWGGQLFDNGRVVAAKRKAGRPRIHTQDEIQKIAAVEQLSELVSDSIPDSLRGYEFEELVRAS